MNGRRFTASMDHSGMCVLCSKRLEHHFGGVEYRCDPKPESIVVVEASSDYATLKGLYNAVVHERDRLRSRVEALEGQVRDLGALEVSRLFCDECQTAEVSVTGPKTKGFDRVIAIARERGWAIDGLGHLCPVCVQRRVK